MRTAEASPRSREERYPFEVWVVVGALIVLSILPSIGKLFLVADQADSEGLLSSSGSLLGQVVWSLMYVGAAIGLLSLRDRALPLLARSVPLIAFTLMTLVSTLWSAAPGISLRNSVEMIGTTVIAYYLVARFDLSQFLKMLTITFTAIALMSMFLVLFAPGRGRMWDSGAWAGFYAEKNGLGAAMALSILTLVIVFARARGRQRLLTLVPLALSVALLFGSRSITAVVVWSATVIIVIALSLCRSARFGFAARIASVLLLVIVPVTLLASGIDSNTLFELVGKQSNLTGRTEFWPAVVQAIGDRPILGYGFNAFFSQDGPWVAYMSALTVEWGWIPFHAHNSFYQIALDVGLVGEALFLYVLGSGLFRAATFLMRGSDPMYLWPLAVIVYLTLGSFTETYFASENTIESILFTTALLYPLREPLQKVATYAKAASGRRRSIPVGDPSLAKRQDVRQRPANVTQP